MISNLIPTQFLNIYYGILILGSFFIAFFGIKLFRGVLPKDQGREYAVNGQLSEGKPRGAGIILIIAFILSSVLFVPLNSELIIYLALIFIEMMSGYLDDGSKVPWGEYKKGLIDLVVAVGISVTYYSFNGSVINFAMLGLRNVKIPAAVFIILGVILVWAAINVTNCSDGVDGLCGSLSTISLMTAFVMLFFMGKGQSLSPMLLIMVITITAYLWFNASPSKLLMGDAGSRALGVVLAIAFLKTGSPFTFIFAAFMLILDGGLGLIKVSAIRYLKLQGFMKNIRTPIHDHMRKIKGWSDTQVVFRFSILQIIISLVVIAFALKI